MARGCFSLAAPLRHEAPLRRQQALCTKTRRISRLGARGTISCSPQNVCWLLAEHVLLDKHISQNAAIPNCSPKPEPVSHSALKAANGHLHPQRQLPQHRHDEGRKGQRKGPWPRWQVRARRPPLCCPLAVTTDITNQSQDPPLLSTAHSGQQRPSIRAGARKESHFSHLPSQPWISDKRAAFHLWAHICLMS